MSDLGLASHHLATECNCLITMALYVYRAPATFQRLKPEDHKGSLQMSKLRLSGVS